MPRTTTTSRECDIVSSAGAIAGESAWFGRGERVADRRSMLTNPAGLNGLTSTIIDAAIRVHRETGPGLLEGVYVECLAFELLDRRLDVERGVKIPLTYRGRKLSSHYLLDLRVDRCVIVEVKSVAQLAPVHSAQLITYLKLTGCRVGLLINFNVPLLKQGIRRIVLPEQPRVSKAEQPNNGGTE
jgi:GxxExxY protein